MHLPPVKSQITGMFSSMHYVEEAGDVIGMEIFIIDGGDGYYATVQIAQGAPDPPVLVKIAVKGPVIEFILPNSSTMNLGKFSGKISARGMVGKFQNAEKSEFLSRRKSYWQ